MPLIRAILIILAAMAALTTVPASAQTFGSCTVGAANASLGSASSFTVGSSAISSSGSSGLACSAISVATVSFLKVKLESSTLVLSGPGGRTIPFIVSSTANGPAIPVGAESDYSSLNLLNLFTGPGGTVPLHFRTVATAGLPAGTYQGTVTIRWYFSICSLGVAVCLSYSQSPGFVRPTLLAPTTNWGSGVATTVTVSLIVEKDCIIAAPDVEFGTAAFVSQFNPVTRTISIRCSAGASYSVGLSNGDNYANGSRRMKFGTNYLRYELYRGTAGTNRWGPTGAERRSSTSAEINPGTYDASTLQGFTYRAIIDPAQSTPPAGRYIDTIILDVTF